MEQNVPNNQIKSLTFIDVVRMFKKKTVILIVCLSLVAAILGGVGGYIYFSSSSSYGTEITFYLSYKDSTHALLPLLNSDSFAEKLLLDENGLPPKAECDLDDYNKASAAVEAYNEAVMRKREYAILSKSFPSAIAEKKSVYDSDLAEYNRIYNLLNAYLSAYQSATENTSEKDVVTTASELLEKISDYEIKLNEAATKMKASKEEYDAISSKKLVNDVNLAKAKQDVKDTRLEMEGALEVVLKNWREKDDIREKIDLIRESVSFEYAKLNESNVASETVENENAAFLIITINVDDDEDMAKFITEQVILRTPDYVEKNIERINDVSDPHCTLISTFADTRKNIDSEMLKNTLLVTAISGGGTLAASCAVVVLYNLIPEDMKKKKKA